VVLFLCAAPALAVEWFAPPPQFSSDYVVPPTHYAEPRPDASQVLGLAALAVALAGATVLTLKKRSRPAIFVLMCACVAYFGFWRQGCICPVGSVQNVAYALFDSSYLIPWTVIGVFVLPLIFTLVFGRGFCAAVCPLGGVQDLVLLRPVRVPRWLDSGLRVLPYLYLGSAVLFAATGSAFIICRYDPFVAIFRLSAGVNMLVLGACFLVIGMFVGRPYCRFLCPYGALLGMVSRVSKWRVTITPAECVQCKLCEDACPFGAIQPPAVGTRQSEMPQAKRRIGALLLALPVLVAAGVVLGGWTATPFSKVHPRVRLAERVVSEERGDVEGATDASDAFREGSQPVDELTADALRIRGNFVVGGRWLGAFMGLVIACTLLHLSVGERRTDYEADRGMCLACGRCFAACPIERKRRKELQVEST